MFCGGSVEPEDGGEVAVVGEQLLDLRDGLGVEVGVEVAVLGLVPVVGDGVVVAAQDGGGAGRGPVLVLRVVEAELDALLAASAASSFSGSRLKGVAATMLNGFAFESNMAKPSWCLAVMTMYFMPAALASATISCALKPVGLNCAGERFVVGDGDGGVVHDPLADAGDLLAVPGAGGDGVEAPVDEHAEAGLAPPRHAGVLLRGGLGVLDGGDGMLRTSGGIEGSALKLRAGGGRGGREHEQRGGEAAAQGEPGG